MEQGVDWFKQVKKFVVVQGEQKFCKGMIMQLYAAPAWVMAIGEWNFLLPSSASTQLQLKLWLRLALFPSFPATHDSSFLQKSTHDYFKIIQDYFKEA